MKGGIFLHREPTPAAPRVEVAREAPSTGSLSLRDLLAICSRPLAPPAFRPLGTPGEARDNGR
jgi:hypothetical protein